MASTILNVSQWVKGGADSVQQSRSTSGRPYGDLPAAGEGVGMLDLPGLNSASFTAGEPEILEIEGGDGIRAVIQFPNDTLPQVDLEFADFQGEFYNDTQGLNVIDVQSVYNFYVLGAGSTVLTDQFLMLTRKAVSTQAGSQGNGFETLLFPLASISPLNPYGDAATGPNQANNSYRASMNRVSLTPWGQTISEATNAATSEAAGFIFWSQYKPTFDVFVQDGTTDTFTPTKPLAPNSQVIAWDVITGTPTTLATSISSGDFSFTAGTSDAVTLFMYERVDA